MVATHLALRPRCRAVHLNMCVVAPPYAPLWGALWGAPRWLSAPLGRWLLSDAERAALARTKAFAFRASYYAVHALQPLALGAALVDSPIGAARPPSPSPLTAAQACSRGSGASTTSSWTPPRPSRRTCSARRSRSTSTRAAPRAPCCRTRTTRSRRRSRASARTRGWA
jgi:hypothetical protein